MAQTANAKDRNNRDENQTDLIRTFSIHFVLIEFDI